MTSCQSSGDCMAIRASLRTAPLLTTTSMGPRVRSTSWQRRCVSSHEPTSAPTTTESFVSFSLTARAWSAELR